MLFRKSLIFFLLVTADFLSAQNRALVADAGPNKEVCFGNQTTIGADSTAKYGTPPYIYTWTPAASLSNANVSNPTASPTVTTVYTVTVSDKTGMNAKSTVTVSVLSYGINAGHDTTIKEGQTITLHGQAPGYSVVYWGINSGDSTHIFNQNTLSPDVFPQITTHYVFIAVFPGGCTLYDDLFVTVVPDDHLYFFNSFSPNGDQVNDFFIIGNIGFYPNNTLDVYNRYGLRVFTKTGYNNDWNGSYLGNELPCGTYFYILDTHDPNGGKYHGEVNIIK